MENLISSYITKIRKRFQYLINKGKSKYVTNEEEGIMGYSNFTREGLYINAYRMIDEIDGFCSYNRDKIKQVFYNSAVLIAGFEERIIQDDDVEIGSLKIYF